MARWGARVTSAVTVVADRAGVAMPYPAAMPHLIIEHGSDLSDSDQERLLRNAHQAMLDSGEVRKAGDLKSRIRRVDRHLVGNEGPQASFIHAELRLLVGRSPETRQALADAILAALVPDLGSHVQVSVEINELPAAYAKRQLPQ